MCRSRYAAGHSQRVDRVAPRILLWQQLWGHVANVPESGGHVENVPPQPRATVRHHELLPPVRLALLPLLLQLGDVFA
jgi:hypothetical protein